MPKLYCHWHRRIYQNIYFWRWLHISMPPATDFALPKYLHIAWLYQQEPPTLFDFVFKHSSFHKSRMLFQCV